MPTTKSPLTSTQFITQYKHPLTQLQLIQNIQTPNILDHITFSPNQSPGNSTQQKMVNAFCFIPSKSFKSTFLETQTRNILRNYKITFSPSPVSNKLPPYGSSSLTSRHSSHLQRIKGVWRWWVAGYCVCYGCLCVCVLGGWLGGFRVWWVFSDLHSWSLLKP